MSANTVQIIINAVDKTREAISSASAGFKRLQDSTSNVFGDLGAAVAIAALAAFGKSALDSADDLSKMAVKTGISIESLSLLKPIAEQSGVSIQALGTGLKKLASNMVSAAGGSKESAATFARLGIAVKDATGQIRPTEAVLMQLADQFAKMPDGAAKSALAVELFGKAGVDMIPFLNQGAAGIEELKQKFKDLGLEIDGPTGAAAEKFNDTLDTVKQALTGIALQIIQAALPAMQSLADGMVNIAKNAQSIIPIITTVGEVILAALGARALLGIGALVTNMTKMLALWRLLSVAGLAYGAIRLTELTSSFFKTRQEVDAVTQATQKGAAETELLVRAANELNGQGALSLKTQLDLAALAAQKVRDNLPAVATALTDVGKTASAAGSQIKAALQDEVKRAATTVKALSDAYKQANADIGASLKERLASIDQSYKQQADSAKQAAQSEAQQIAGTTQALINAEAQKIAAIFNAATDMQAAWQQTYSAAIALATQAGEAEIQAARDAGIGIEQAQRDTAAKIAQIDREFAQQKLSAYEQIASAYRGTVDRLIAEEQRHLQAARSAEEARLNLKLSVEDRIRSLLQKGMDDQAAHADRQKQIDEKQSAARQALAQGDYEKARKLSEESLALIERNATEVTKTVTENGKTTTEVVLSQGRASVQAMGEMRESADIADQALLKLGDSHKQAGAAAGQGANAAKSALEGVTAEIATLREALAQQGQMVISVNTDAAKKGVDDIQAYLNAAALVAQIALDTATAQASVKALQADLDNLSLVAKVEADTRKVLTDIAALKNITADARLVIPAAADFSAAENTLRQFAADAKTTLSQPTAHTHTVRANTASAEAAIDRLERNTYSTHTIRVKKVEENALGGLVGAAQRFAAGGQAWADHAASAYRRMSGRISGPGTDTSDNIPALLSPGEYVNRASSVRRFGVAFFDALNAGQLPDALMPRMALAGGGLVAGLPDPYGSAGSAGAARDSIDINLRIGSQTLPLQGSRATAAALASALRDLSRGG